VITDSWPGQMRTVYGDHERFVQTYFSTYRAMYFTGDGCRRDEDGYYWITGRVDDVINVSGHRMGTAEVESALVAHEGLRGRRRRLPARHQGPGHLCLRHADGGRGADDELQEELVKHGCAGNRPDRLAGPDPVLARACRKPAPARSCAASCARSPRTISRTFDNLGDTSTLADPGRRRRPDRQPAEPPGPGQARWNIRFT
jgi:acetyl-CoA synthetase